MKLTTRLLLIITLSIPQLVFPQSKIDAASGRLSTVVIDAGHGGKDPGCSWGEKLEKDLNLKIALALGSMIEEAYDDVKVIYTRRDDRFVELHERGDMANRANADLFISIHTDAVSNTEANGSSTYIMGNDKSQKNLAVAQRENSVIVMEGDYEAKYEGYDPSSDESFIIFSLMQYAYSEQSMLFAEMVQKHYAKNTTIVDRGARQGPYLVLWRTAMPAVLTEIGFMTNKKDRDYLHSEEGQKQVTKALFDAFSEYRTRCNEKAQEVMGGGASAAKETPAPVATKPAPKQEEKPTAAAPKQEAKPVATTPKQEEKAAPKQEEKPTAAAPKQAQEALVEGGYYVQICTLSKESDPKDRKFAPYSGRIVQRKTSSGKWRCLVPAKTLEEARTLQREAEGRFPGAFIVREKGGEFSRVAAK